MSKRFVMAFVIAGALAGCGSSGGTSCSTVQEGTYALSNQILSGDACVAAPDITVEVSQEGCELFVGEDRTGDAGTGDRCILSGNRCEYTNAAGQQVEVEVASSTTIGTLTTSVDGEVSCHTIATYQAP